MSIFLEIMKEELNRNLDKQKAFEKEFALLPKGYLSICMINKKPYVYRKRRVGNKIVSQYVGVVGDDNVKKAQEEREKHLYLKQSIKELKNEEIRLRRAIRDYARI